MKKILIPLLFFLIVEGCKREKPIDYFPLEVGNRWVYVAGFSEDLTDTLTYEVLERRALHTGKSIWKMVLTWNRPQNSYVDSFSVDKSEGKVVVSPMIETTTPPYVVLELPVEIGKGWVVAKLPSGRFRRATIVGVETINLPQKTFEGCIKIESSEVPSDTLVRTDRSYQDWYAPDIGRVRSIIKETTRVYEMRLIDYRLADVSKY